MAMTNSYGGKLMVTHFMVDNFKTLVMNGVKYRPSNLQPEPTTLGPHTHKFSRGKFVPECIVTSSLIVSINHFVNACREKL